MLDPLLLPPERPSVVPVPVPASLPPAAPVSAASAVSIVAFFFGATEDPGPILTGAELRILRTRAGMLQRELARELHYHQSRVSQWERGKSPIPLAVARELLRILQDLEQERRELRALLKSSFL